MDDDLIDFPVSADWLDFYHERGLTKRSSGRISIEYKQIVVALEKIVKMLDEHEKILEMLLEKTQQKQNFSNRHEKTIRKIELDKGEIE